MKGCHVKRKNFESPASARACKGGAAAYASGAPVTSVLILRHGLECLLLCSCRLALKTRSFTMQNLGSLLAALGALVLGEACGVSQVV